MIEGMEILKRTEIIEKEFTKYSWVPLILGFVIALALLILFAFSIDWFMDKLKTGGCFVVALLVACCALASIVFGIATSLNSTKDVSTGKCEYEVVLDDTVSLKEVYEHYEVVETKGDIYVLRDKEENQHD